MAKKASQDKEGPAKKSKPKESNPARNAKEVRAYSREFMEWAVKCQEIMVSAAARMEQFDPNFETVLITSMVDKYKQEIEKRIEKQFGSGRSKLTKDLAKERARRMVRDIIQGKID